MLRFNRASAFFGSPRRWSNWELAKFAHLFQGPVVNVSAWADQDKEGRTYQSYFPRQDYWISNFGTSQGEMQGTDNEFYLDLEADLPAEHERRFATVFNHTTLEHIWDFRKAFSNLCALSNDAVILVVPWLQPLHSDYGDYWRFSPQAVVRMFEEEGFTVVHLSWNHEPRQSVYVFAIAMREPSKRGYFIPVRSSDPGFLKVPKNGPGDRAFDV